MKLFALFLFFSASVWAQETSIKLYPVHYTNPDEAAGIIPLMLSSTNGLSVQPVDRKLVVRGTAEQHSEILKFLRELDKAPKNIQVNVQFTSSGRSENNEIGVRPNGPVIIRDGQVQGSLSGRFSSQSTASSENTTQMLVAMDGRSATLRVGERVPYLAWLTEYGCRHGYIREVQIEWLEVGSFLAVYPEIIGDGPMIRIRLVPELSGRLKDGTEQTIQFAGLATEVIAQDGQTVSIGGFDQDAEFSSKFLVGRSGGSESSITDISFTPRILQ